MEYTQWAKAKKAKELKIVCLNPCCNGIYSMSSNQALQIVLTLS